jgi:hypothetical protein
VREGVEVGLGDGVFVRVGDGVLVGVGELVGVGVDVLVEVRVGTGTGDDAAVGVCAGGAIVGDGETRASLDTIGVPVTVGDGVDV